jgi:hypothetical protein
MSTFCDIFIYIRKNAKLIMSDFYNFLSYSQSLIMIVIKSWTHGHDRDCHQCQASLMNM